jgi:hypothetical protein
MSALEIFIPVLIVAGVWGYILLNASTNNKRILDDDVLSANDERRKEAESTMRSIHLMTPVLVIVLVVAVVFLVNAYHPFIRLNIDGVALISGGLLFTYLGWALGMIFKGKADEIGEKDAKLLSRSFMISFMGGGLLVTASGVIACIPSLAAYF